ncbi:MAG: HAMP domain-containing histidine kinase [Deltaproteobacteria bacterium]|nr:MAG: HAMP domain-containing histidine kinase [Deltaproteobacteria bacterium]
MIQLVLILNYILWLEMNKRYQFLIGILIFITCTAFGMAFFNFAISEFSDLIIQKIEEKNNEKYNSLISTVRNDVLMDDMRTVKNQFDSWVEKKQIAGYKIVKGENTQVAGTSISSEMQGYNFPIQYTPEKDWGKILIFDYKLGSEQIKSNILSEYFLYFGFFVLLLSVVIYKMISFLFSEINPLLNQFLSMNEIQNTENLGFRLKLFKPMILALNHTAEKIKELEEERVSYEAEKAQLSLGRKIAHDIRSPLEALKVASTSENGKELTEMAISRIESIANSLLDETREQKKVKRRNLAQIINELLKEKSAIWKESAELNFIDSLNEEFLVDEAISRILSNLLNNSWEASQRGKIKVQMKLSTDEEGRVFLSISDNGLGMSQFQLEKVMREGLSIGKEKGNAIGISTAISFMKKYNGTFDMTSRLGEGTRIILTFS